jgi:cobalt-zinc-cadmium efflux system outer membrane protein
MRRAFVMLAALLAGPLPEAATTVPIDCTARLPLPLTLEVAERRVALCNRDVRAALAALEMASADLRIARQRPNPTLSVGASNVNPHAGVGGGTLRDKTLDSFVRLEQLVERGGKPALRARLAEAAYEAARADVDEQVRLQRLAMRGAFFDIAAAQERVRLQRDFQAIANQSTQTSRQRLEAGDIARTEDNRIRLDAARALNDLLQAEADARRARGELARTIGAEGIADPIEVVPAWPDSEGAAPAPGERPDVAAARLRVRSAEAAWALARSLATRDVQLGVQADRWPASETNVQGTGVSYGFIVSIPLHVRHANEGEAARALADLSAARVTLQRLEAQASAESRLARADLDAARERRRRVESAVGPLAREVASAAEFAYRRGATGVLDLLDARRSLKAVELDEVQARAEAAKAWARFEASRETIEE